MQAITILGIQIKDHTKRESLSIVDSFLRNRALDIVLYLDSRELTIAGKDEELRHFVEEAGLTLWSTSDLIEVAGLKNDKRHREVENREFLKELLHKLARNHQAIAVVSDSEEKAEQLKKELFAIQDKLSIVRCQEIDFTVDNMEQSVNVLNSVAPTMVIARLPLKQQSVWLMKAKHMLNAGVWLALPEDMNVDEQKRPPIQKAKEKVKEIFFLKKLMKSKEDF